MISHVQSSNTAVCFRKECGKPAYKYCSRCQEVYYCSVKCQTDDWSMHKKECGDMQEMHGVYGQISSIKKEMSEKLPSRIRVEKNKHIAALEKQLQNLMQKVRDGRESDTITISDRDGSEVYVLSKKQPHAKG